MDKVAIDTETTGLNYWTGAMPFAVSMCFDDMVTKYWEWPVDIFTRKPQFYTRNIKQINKITEDPTINKCFWNAKFDIGMLKTIGVNVVKPFTEVQFKAKACNNLELSYGLKPIAKKVLGFSADDEEKLKQIVITCRKIAKKLKANISDEVIEDYWLPYTLYVHYKDKIPDNYMPLIADFITVCKTYAVNDAERTMLLEKYFDYGMKELKMENVYNFEMELFDIVIDIESIGVMIDEKRLKSLQARCNHSINYNEKLLKKAYGSNDFNIKSPKQLVSMLFEGKPLNLNPIEVTKKGQPKTDAEVLMKYKSEPLVEAILKYKANTTAINTFFSKYKKLAVDKILHPSFNQWGTLTGRFSCKNPNLQQASNPTTSASKVAEYMINIQQVFIPRKNHVWYCADYSQLEVIIFAAITGEQSLISAINRGEDIHAATAQAIWGGKNNLQAIKAVSTLLKSSDTNKAVTMLDKFNWNINDIEDHMGTKIWRKNAKGVNFLKIYGGGAKTLSERINCSQIEARAVLNNYDSAFPEMVKKMKRIMDEGHNNGFIRNSFGRYLTIDNDFSYRSVNYWVQSDAADLMKRGMVKCYNYLKSLDIGAKLILTIHDELIFEFKKGTDKPKIINNIKELMEDNGDIYTIKTPVDIDKVTERWSKKEKIKG